VIMDVHHIAQRQVAVHQFVRVVSLSAKLILVTPDVIRI